MEYKENKKLLLTIPQIIICSILLTKFKYAPESKQLDIAIFNLLLTKMHARLISTYHDSNLPANYKITSTLKASVINMDNNFKLSMVKVYLKPFNIQWMTVDKSGNYKFDISMDKDAILSELEQYSPGITQCYQFMDTNITINNSAISSFSNITNMLSTQLLVPTPPVKLKEVSLKPAPVKMKLPHTVKQNQKQKAVIIANAQQPHSLQPHDDKVNLEKVNTLLPTSDEPLPALFDDFNWEDEIAKQGLNIYS